MPESYSLRTANNDVDEVASMSIQNTHGLDLGRNSISRETAPLKQTCKRARESPEGGIFPTDEGKQDPETVSESCSGVDFHALSVGTNATRPAI